MYAIHTEPTQSERESGGTVTIYSGMLNPRLDTGCTVYFNANFQRKELGAPYPNRCQRPPDAAFSFWLQPDLWRVNQHGESFLFEEKMKEYKGSSYAKEI